MQFYMKFMKFFVINIFMKNGNFIIKRRLQKAIQKLHSHK